MRKVILAGSLLLFAGGCGGEMTPQDVANEMCACFGKATSIEEAGACSDQSSPSGVVLKAYGEKLMAEGVTKKELSQNPVFAQITKCLNDAAHKK